MPIVAGTPNVVASAEVADSAVQYEFNRTPVATVLNTQQGGREKIQRVIVVKVRNHDSNTCRCHSRARA